MKRRDLLKKISDAAKAGDLIFAPIRNKGDHEVFTLDGQRVIVPRHTEINEVTAREILKSLEDKLGKDWWKK